MTDLDKDIQESIRMDEIIATLEKINTMVQQITNQVELVQRIVDDRNMQIANMSYDMNLNYRKTSSDD